MHRTKDVYDLIALPVIMVVCLIPVVVLYRLFGSQNFFGLDGFWKGVVATGPIGDIVKSCVRERVDYALERGWRLQKAGPRAHIWGLLFCPRAARDGCRWSVLSTPRVPENHARQIRRVVDQCPHHLAEDEEP
jgi:hypothetical protein